MQPIILVLLALPLAAGLLLWSLRRSKSLSSLVPALTLSGLTGAILTSCFAFTSTTVPIPPYETGPGAWGPLIGQLLLALIIGFGIGVLVAAVAGIPYWYFSGRANPS
jgi:hypothetical protein